MSKFVAPKVSPHPTKTGFVINANDRPSPKGVPADTRHEGTQDKHSTEQAK